jgi:hypothetical protein
MNQRNSENAAKIIAKILHGSQLDTIRIYSVILQLGFIRLTGANDLPEEIWLNLSCSLRVETDASIFECSKNFHGRRIDALTAVYQLIGREVHGANVSATGTLEIELGDTRLFAEPDGETDLEEVWSVVSDSPEANADHRWRVILDDFGVISIRTPNPSSEVT